MHICIVDDELWPAAAIRKLQATTLNNERLRFKVARIWTRPIDLKHSGIGLDCLRS